MSFVQVSEKMRLSYRDGHLLWEEYNGKTWEQVFLPKRYFPDNEETQENTKADNILSLSSCEDVMFLCSASDKKSDGNDYFYPDVIDRIESFLSTHTPWIFHKWNRRVLDDYYLVFSEVFGAHVPDNIDPLIIAQLGTCTPLVEMGVEDRAFDDGFYRTNCINVPLCITSHKDLKSSLTAILGVYDKNIANIIKDKVSRKATYCTEWITLMRILYGLPKEHIIDLLLEDIFFSDIPDHVFYRGAKNNDGLLVLPQWYTHASDYKRMTWIRQGLDILFQCFSLSFAGDQEVHIDNNTSNIYTIHNRLADEQNRIMNLELNDIISSPHDYNSINYDSLSFPVRPLTTSQDLITVGKHMDICIGSYGYVNRLGNGTSQFYLIPDENNLPTVAEFSAENNVIVEHRGTSNKEVSSIAQKRAAELTHLLKKAQEKNIISIRDNTFAMYSAI